MKEIEELARCFEGARVSHNDEGTLYISFNMSFERIAFKKIVDLFYILWYYKIYKFVILFLVVLVILCTQKPFSKILLRCSTGLGILYIVTAIIVPRLPDFELQIFILVGINDVIIFEGFYFIIGLVLIIFSVLMKAGFDYQTQLEDEML